MSLQPKPHISILWFSNNIKKKKIMAQPRTALKARPSIVAPFFFSAPRIWPAWK